ncbi:MAG: NAD(P)/FAD-dependent oxidoreductase [Deltaproteobacteria bacterium]|nr:NAD(P)/FAD-dependent oxidoreductase [Deltaproteobacteria bacterium]
MADYDVCVIGAGPAGFAAAMRAWDFGKTVCIVEKSELGGTGVHNGALSSKTMWELSRDYRIALRRDRGYSADNVNVDFRQVAHCVDVAVDEKVSQMRRQLEALREPLPGCPGSVHWIAGTARFLDPHTVQVDGNEPGTDTTVVAKNFVVATGSRPRILPNIEVDGHYIMTSDHVMGLTRFPRSLVILGAGVVGCEFATIFANYGQTKVYLIDRGGRILPFEDEDVSRVCSSNLERKGVSIHHRSNLVSMERVGEQVAYTIEHHTGGRETIQVDHAIISVGRVPNNDGLGLDKAGVKLTPNGHIADDDTRTSQPHIYAVGDITQDVALVSIGEIEGRHAVEKMFTTSKKKLDYDNISSIYFLDPEVAAIGLNEQQAQELRIPYRVAVYGYNLNNRAIAMRATGGFVKLLTTDCEDLRILGMRACGVHASTTIEAVSLMMKAGHSVRDLAELFHPHPAVTEAVQDCVRMLLGSSIYKPEVFTSDLRLSRIEFEQPNVDEIKA